MRRSALKNNRGFTFVEVMLAVAILSAGIVGVFRSYLISLDRMTLLTNRLNATIVLDNQITSMERTLRAFNALPFELDPVEKVQVGAKLVEFNKQVDISQVAELQDIFELNLTLSWTEKGREVRLNRSAYLSNFKDQ